MAERFEKLTDASMDSAQRRVASAIAGTRGGDGARGPFHLWLRAPEMADRLQRVGAYIRYESALPQRLIELAICVVAVEWEAPYEWHAHAPLAMEAGLDPAILLAVAERGPLVAPEEETVVVAFCAELLRSHHVSDMTLERAKVLFGESGVAELVGTCGYYVAVAMSLNVAEVSLPEDARAFALPSR